MKRLSLTFLLAATGLMNACKHPDGIARAVEPDRAAEFSRVWETVYDRVSEPYVIGGEVDTRLVIHVIDKIAEIGDAEFARMLREIAEDRRDALRVVVGPESLKARGLA